MAYKEITVGADRFLALQWANFAYELFVSTSDQVAARNILREYMGGQLVGQESIRKTANQLNRLWLQKNDVCAGLRDMTLQFLDPSGGTDLPILHLGLAINIFPIYKETVRVIGTLSGITDKIPPKAIADRVIEKFPNPTSIPRSVTRVLQTLKDWNMIEFTRGMVVVRETPLLKAELVNWFMLALLQANALSEISLQGLENDSLKLGIVFSHLRSVVNQSNQLILSRNHHGIEIIKLKQVDFWKT